jgi:hypothetical protein
MVPVELVVPALPICIENKPPKLVLIARVSEYTTGPADELFRIDNRRFIDWLGKGLPMELRATPW